MSAASDVSFSLMTNEFCALDTYRAKSCCQASDDNLSSLHEVLKGDYESCLKSSVIQKLLIQASDSAFEQNDIQHWVKENVVNFMSSDISLDGHTRELIVLSTAISCLQLFIQANLTGPSLTLSDSLLLLEQNVPCGDVLSQLSVGSDPVYNLCASPVLLLIAKSILLGYETNVQFCKTWNWWAIRALRAHQALLDDRSPSLKAQICDRIQKFDLLLDSLTLDNTRSYKTQFYIEAGLLMYFYYEPVQAKEYLSRAKEEAGCKVELTGVMGKRTRFQHKEIAQLVLSVQKEEGDAVLEDETIQLIDASKLPKDLLLSDDTVLDNLQLTDHSPTDVTPLEQALVLALCLSHHRGHEGQSSIMTEELQAYINFVLSSPKCWAVQTLALYERSKSEADSVRRLERSRAQLEELSSQFHSSSTTAKDRLPLVHSVNMPPTWLIQKRNCEMLLAMGLAKEALELSLQLELWDNVIQCYARLGRMEKAESVIREQLAIQETPLLWCYLGDVRNDVQCYEKAWELSGHRFARAKRSVGFYHLRQQQFESCIEPFEKALEINPLLLDVWFSYGCACMSTKRFESAAKAFRRCVLIEADNFQAWNNMSAAYVQLKEKSKAFMVLEEALKCDFENWRLWENILIIGIDIGEFERVIQAYHRLLDLKNNDYVDKDILGILNRSVKEDISDSSGVGASRLRGKLSELFGRITSKVTTNAAVWCLYAEHILSHPDPSATDIQRALQCYQKSNRCLTQQRNWEHEAAYCEDVLTQLHSTATVLQSRLDAMPPSDAIQAMSSLRLTINGCLAKIKMRHKDPITNELPDNLKDLFQSVEDLIPNFMSKIKTLKDSQ